MSDSGQTEEERRVVRRRQRSLAKDIQETGADMEDVSKATFAEKRKKNNEIYKEVNYAREAALDAENLVAISEKVSKQANKLVSAVRYDTDKVIKQLIKRSSFSEDLGGGFDWEKLGKAAGRCFNMVPFIQFMNGPLRKEVKERKEKVSKKRVRVDEEAEEERPEEVLTQQKDKNSLSGMEDIIKSVNKTLKRTVERKSSSSSSTSSKKKRSDPSSNPACVVKLVVNPKSFTQTAENILALSFQVKKGDIAVKTNEEGLPVAFPTAMRQHTPMSKQSVLSLNMKQWREMVKEYHVKDDDGVPTRATGGKKS
jgi:non-structural maintenance of chromosomes element 4